MHNAQKIAVYHNGQQRRAKLKQTERFYDKNRVNLNNFTAITLKVSEKFDYHFHMFL